MILTLSGLYLQNEMNKNIALLTTTYLPVQGGVQYLLYWILSEIDNNFTYYQKKYDFNNFYLISTSPSGNKYSKFKNIKLLELRNNKTKLNKLLIIFQVSYFVISNKINLIHSHNAYFDSMCCNIAKKISGLKYLITSHGDDIAYLKEFNYGGMLSERYRDIVKNNIKNASFISTISNDMCKFAYEVSPKKKIVLIPNPLPYKNNNLDAGLIDREIKSIRSKFGLNEDNIICLTLSGSREIKGHDNMLRGFKTAYVNNNE